MYIRLSDADGAWHIAWRTRNRKRRGGSSSSKRATRLTLQLQNPGKGGSGVSAPKAIAAPDPEYSVEAREARISGTAVFGLVVDNAGVPKEIEVVRPLGYGLDEKGVVAIQSWRFDPAKKDGKAVAVHIDVEMQFRMW